VQKFIKTPVINAVLKAVLIFIVEFLFHLKSKQIRLGRAIKKNPEMIGIPDDFQ
jgi:hypothetical protein